MLTFEVFNERQQRARSYRDEVASLVFDFLFLTISANRNALIKYRSRKEDTYIIAANIKRRSRSSVTRYGVCGHLTLTVIADKRREVRIQRRPLGEFFLLRSHTPRHRRCAILSLTCTFFFLPQS